jgi:hypothetical protein
VIGLAEHVERRAAHCGVAVEHRMQPGGQKSVRDFLGARPIGNAREGFTLACHGGLDSTDLTSAFYTLLVRARPA